MLFHSLPIACDRRVTRGHGAVHLCTFQNIIISNVRSMLLIILHFIFYVHLIYVFIVSLFILYYIYFICGLLHISH
jgi:hypothetical protein